MKTALVTGAASGLGMAITAELEQHNYKVLAWDTFYDPVSYTHLTLPTILLV